MENYLPQMPKTTLCKSLHQADTPQIGNAVKMAKIQFLVEVHQTQYKCVEGERQAGAIQTNGDCEDDQEHGENTRHPQGGPNGAAKTSDITKKHEGDRKQTRRPHRAATRRTKKKPRQARQNPKKGKEEEIDEEDGRNHRKINLVQLQQSQRPRR